MEKKFVLLKSNWGIVIYLGIREIKAYTPESADYKINHNVYLKILDDSKLDKNKIRLWFAKAVNDIYETFDNLDDTLVVCYQIYLLDFAYAHFQEEGLYYAFLDWFSAYYKLPTKEINAYFDESANRYVFPDLK